MLPKKWEHKNADSSFFSGWNVKPDVEDLSRYAWKKSKNNTLPKEAHREVNNVQMQVNKNIINTISDCLLSFSWSSFYNQNVDSWTGVVLDFVSTAFLTSPWLVSSFSGIHFLEPYAVRGVRVPVCRPRSVSCCFQVTAFLIQTKATPIRAAER